MKTIQEAINHCRERSANARSKECQCDHLDLLGWLEELITLQAEVARLAKGQDWLLRQVQHHCPPGIICRDGQSCLDCWREELRLAVGEGEREKGEKDVHVD